MSDPTLFLVGAIVSLLALSGAWIYVYAQHFRPRFVDENLDEAAAQV